MVRHDTLRPPQPGSTEGSWRSGRDRAVPTRSFNPDSRWSVPAVALGVGPGAAGRGVAALDVVEPPVDLGLGVGTPVGRDGAHLGTGQRLRDPVRTRGRVR